MSSKKVWIARIFVEGECLMTKFYRDEPNISPREIRHRLNLWIQEEQLDDKTLPITIVVKQQEFKSVPITVQEGLEDSK